MAGIKSNAAWTDTLDLTINSSDGESHSKEKITIDELRSRMLADPYGIVEKRVNVYIDLSMISTIYKNLITVPAGSIIKHVALLLISSVSAGGTSVALALGQHGATPPATYGFTGGLNQADKLSNLILPAILNADTDIELMAVNADGTALGDTAFNSGWILFSITFDTPVQF